MHTRPVSSPYLYQFEVLMTRCLAVLLRRTSKISGQLKFNLSIALLGFLVALPGLGAQELLVQPQQLDLGTVKLAQTSRGGVQVSNTGADKVELAVSAAGPYFVARPEKIELEAGAQGQIEIVFVATEAGFYEDELSLEVAAFFKKDPLVVPLQAVAARPLLRMDIEPGQPFDLGPVQVGRQVRRALVLANDGPVSLHLDSLQLAVADSPFSLLQDGGVELAPGEEVQLWIEFAPPGRGEHRQQLLIHAADLKPAHRELEIAGVGLAPQIAVSPLAEVGLRFPIIEIGRKSQLEFTVLNQGAGDLKVEQVVISGGAFSLGAEAEEGADLAPQERWSTAVYFQPRYEGPATGLVQIHTNDPQRPKVELMLQGEGRQSPPRIEIFNDPVMNFGNVAAGRSEKDYLVLWNLGGTPHTVQIDVQEEGEGQNFILDNPAVLLPPGEGEKVAVEFTPRETGEHRASLGITTEAGRQQIQLQGVGKFVQLDPAVLDFGRVVVGTAGHISSQVTNIGNADFIVTGVETTNPDEFSVNSQISTGNKFILPADGLRSVPLDLIFTPSKRGVFSEFLQLEGYWTEGVEPLEIAIQGTGVAAEIALHPAGPIRFDYVVLGEKAIQQLVATNTGDTQLQVQAYPESEEVGIEPGVFALRPGESTTLQVSFSPQALGDRFGQILLVSNDVQERALPLKVQGKGALGNIDLTQVTQVIASRKTRASPLEIPWSNTPIVLRDETKIDLAFAIDPAHRDALIGRKFNIEWVGLDENYDEVGGTTRVEAQIHPSSEGRILAEKLNLRLLDDSARRVRLTVSTANHPQAPPQRISQILEAGGWKWEFEAKPLLSFISIRPGRDYRDAEGQLVKGKTERLVGLPGIAFFGFHNDDSPSISGIHLTAIGNVLEALSTENSIAVSLGLAVSMYKDRFLFGVGWDIYDSRPQKQRRGTQDYIMTFKYWGLL
ncbi:MAG: choice-of-anchor D domain-containing protein [Candidatus Latescibacteria bacterium]|nr:choice-of-anchor D domain-containing protein [Candidatus Latescibacterota bacterium]